jgi:[protein-PII] uridylyltransferase
MSVELFRQLRRAEAQLERAFSGSSSELADHRRRLRIDLLRRHLASGLDSFKARHAEGASGQESVQAHAGFIDAFLRELFGLAVSDARREGLAPARLVLVALGGYGRGELHPSSDIDLMVIHDGELDPFVQRVTQEILYTLWDLGLQVGHSCRSLQDCLAIARTDFPSRTSMQEARYVVGDKRLFQRFQKVLREEIYRKDFAQFLETTLEERDQRYRKFGASPYIGEPNIKESAGGLRDIHTAMWIASTKFGARTLQELAEQGLITDRERIATDEALTFLWRVRNELHFLSGHKNDVLSKSLQLRVAENLGYKDDEASLGVERFMKEHYLHARVIHRISTRLIARCQETLSRRSSAGRRLRQEALADGLVFLDGRLHLAEADGRAFSEDPTRLMKVFWHAHRLGCDLSIDLERAIEESLHLIDDGFRRSPDVRDLFLAICRNWGRVVQTFREMHELGVMGRYLPEWGALTCLVQYDDYHKYTADQHTLLAVENLEALAPGQSAESEGIAQVLSEVEKPELLILGMLLHDIGKSGGHGHVEKGVPLIKRLVSRLDFAPDEALLLIFLVEHHLLMSHVAQRRDIDDPKTVERFAEAAGTPERLRMIYLLTYADTKAVGPVMMTAWKAGVLWELYARTLAHLTGGRPEPPHRDTIARRVAAELGTEGARTSARAHLAGMTDNYLATAGAQRIAAHLRLIERLETETVATEIFHHPDLGSADLVVATRDLPGLFSLIAGTLAANEINILSAQIHTRADGIVLDTLQVSDPLGETLTEQGRWVRVLEDLRRVIRGEQSVESLFESRRPRRGAGETVAGPPKIAIDNLLSDRSTVIEVKCPDRVGVLYLITRTLAREGLDIRSAKIATEIDQAFDVFYVTDSQGRKIEDPEKVNRVREALEVALVTPL